MKASIVLFSTIITILLLVSTVDVFAHDRYLVSTGGDGTVCFWKWDLATLAFE